MIILYQAAAGRNWHEFVAFCLEKQYFGLENLALIPGTVGASVIQNIGAYGAEVKDFVSEVETWEIKTGQKRVWNKEECQFGYRDSVFKKSENLGRWLILSVTFALQSEFVPNLSYRALALELEKRAENMTQISAQDVFETVVEIRRSKLPDPAQVGSAGSFFKNPLIEMEKFLELKQKYPQIPSFAVETVNTNSTKNSNENISNFVKIPAAWLIEQAGYKNFRHPKNPNLGTWATQPLVICNFGIGFGIGFGNHSRSKENENQSTDQSPSGREILQFSQEIQAKVQEKFDILLEREVQIVGIE